MLGSPSSRREAEYLADQLERSFRGGAWHGPAVLEALAGVEAPEAARQPVAGAHGIWETVHHLTAWCDVAHDRFVGEAIPCCLSEEEDWRAVTEVSPRAWQASLSALEAAHRRLHAALGALEDADLDRPVAGSDPTLRGLLFGVLQHNTYHAGQIALLKRVARAGIESP